METYWYASNMRHVMRRDDRVPGLHVHLPHTASQVSQRRWRWTGQKAERPPPRRRHHHAPRCVADLQVMAFFSFIPLSLKKRLDGTDCFRHQTSYSRSVRAVALAAASNVESFLGAFTGGEREKRKTLCLRGVHPLTSSVSPFHSQLMLTGMWGHYFFPSPLTPLPPSPFSLPLLFFLPFLYR